MAKIKATALKVEPRLDYKEDKGLQIYPYDFDNIYPQRVIDIVNDSPTAKTCLQLKNKFVFGSGVVDLQFYKKQVNKKQKVDAFVRKIVEQLNKFGGVAIHVNYNGLGQKINATVVNFEYVRKSLDGNKFVIYDDWGKVKKKSIEKDRVYYVNKYNPDLALREAESEGWENYNGQLFYYNGYEDLYNLSPLDVVLENMLTEAQVKKFKHSVSAKNFLASHILVTGKQESEEAEDEFDENLRLFQGGDGAGTILVIEKESNEDPIELKKVDIQDYDGLYEYTENSSRDAIIQHFLIPPILLLRVAGTLGTADQISDAFDYYNMITSDERLIIEEITKEIFDGWFTDINPSNDYSIKPLNYLDQLNR